MGIWNQTKINVILDKFPHVLDEISLAKKMAFDAVQDDQVTSLQPSWIATCVELENTMDNW